MIASVIVDIKAKQVNRSFDYLVPPHLENVIKIGYRVRVVFGKRVLVGFVVELKNTTTFKLFMFFYCLFIKKRLYRKIVI